MRLHSVIAGDTTPVGMSAGKDPRAGCEAARPVILIFADKVIHRVPGQSLLLLALLGLRLFLATRDGKHR